MWILLLLNVKHDVDALFVLLYDFTACMFRVLHLFYFISYVWLTKICAHLNDKLNKCIARDQ